MSTAHSLAALPRRHRNARPRPRRLPARGRAVAARHRRSGVGGGRRSPRRQRGGDRRRERERRADRALQPIVGAVAPRGPRARLRHGQRRDGEPAGVLEPRRAGDASRVPISSSPTSSAPSRRSPMRSTPAAWPPPAAAWRCASRVPPPPSTPSAGALPPAPGWKGCPRMCHRRAPASSGSPAARRAPPSTRTAISRTSPFGPFPIRRTPDRHRCPIPTQPSPTPTDSLPRQRPPQRRARERDRRHPRRRPAPTRRARRRSQLRPLAPWPTAPRSPSKEMR